MAAAVQESPKGNELIIPNDLDQSVDSQTNLTIRKFQHETRKCYVDPHEAFPQATYYLNHNLKRPNYYLKKEQRFNKKILIQHAPSDANSLLSPSSPTVPAKKRRKKRAKDGQSANSKMEVESESDDDDDTESEEDDHADALNGDEHDHAHFADDELFSDANHGAEAKPKADHLDRNFLNVFPKRDRDDDQKSDSYELDADKLAKLSRGAGAGAAGVGAGGGGEVGFSEEAPLKRKRSKFGAWDGVFVSCLLNIFGVIMFLRLGFVVGQAGLWYTFLIILLASVVTTLTTLSMAAIATNGEQRAGTHSLSALSLYSLSLSLCGYMAAKRAYTVTLRGVSLNGPAR